jgi:glycosyltransferase involved in cell wall biosynthesis
MISVVICAHTEQRWQDLRDAVASVQGQSYPPHEIIVVIDHNPALLDRAVAGIAGARVVPNHEERGLGGARNSGIHHATGDVVAFLDDDATACRGWLALFAEAYRDDSVLGVGGAIDPAWEVGRPAWWPPEFDWTLGCTYRGMPTQPTAVRNLIGCNMSYRREVLETAGRFRLGYGCDETEFCIRASTMWPDGRYLYVPEARVFHRVPAGRSNVRHFITRCYFEGGSKAVVSRLVGAARGLESERNYTRRVLPAGVRSGVRDFVGRRDPAGLRRATAIVLGLAVTSAGYIAGTVSVQAAAERRGWTGHELRRRALRQGQP